MGQLANANLLDDSVANSSSLKNQRLSKTAQKAINPKPRVEYKEEVATKEVEEEEVEIDDDYDDTEVEQNQPPRFSKSSYSNKFEKDDDEEDKSDNKILGMKPALFYGLLAVGVAVGGYFIYKNFIKNKNKKIIDAPPTTPSVDVPTPTGNIG
jgi:hypothetical protein